MPKSPEEIRRRKKEHDIDSEMTAHWEPYIGIPFVTRDASHIRALHRARPSCLSTFLHSYSSLSSNGQARQRLPSPGVLSFPQYQLLGIFFSQQQCQSFFRPEPTSSYASETQPKLRVRESDPPPQAQCLSGVLYHSSPSTH